MGRAEHRRRTWAWPRCREPRLVELGEAIQPEKDYVCDGWNYVDLGGMQKERMRDALAQLREVDVIAHVIRVFDDPSGAAFGRKH